jgi:multiple sugar transport system substrate-binding protein
MGRLWQGAAGRLVLGALVVLGLVETVAAPAAGQEQVELSVWSYLSPDDPSVKAYIERFQADNPGIVVKYTAFPEDDYQDKVRTALSADSPPDIAVMEDKQWMQAGLVVELSPYFAEWGVDPADFAPGGLARATLPDGGIYGVGDHLGGNILFYNKALFDAAGAPHPSLTESMTWPEFDQACRQVGQPDRNPMRAVYGCSVQDWAFDIWSMWVWGEDGRTVLGNLNSDAMVQGYNLGTALVRDGYAPSASIEESLPGGMSDLFAQGKMAMIWSDFTEVAKYQEAGIDFGMGPFVVIEGSESFVDTWTTPWGTFTNSQHPEEALAFLEFMATDAQYIRAETSADPPLSQAVAAEIEWGQGDPIKEDYLAVLQQGKAQVFVPDSFIPLGLYPHTEDEIYRRLTTGGETDAKPILDEQAAATQPALDQAWVEWERLGQEGS